MISAQTPTTLVQRARELFFEQQRDPARWIAPHIARSWQRSRPLEQSDAEPLATTLLRERRDGMAGLRASLHLAATGAKGFELWRLSISERHWLFTPALEVVMGQDDLG